MSNLTTTNNKSGNVRTNDTTSGLMTLVAIFTIFYALLFGALHFTLNSFDLILQKDLTLYGLIKYIYLFNEDFLNNFAGYSISFKLNFFARIIVPLPLAMYFAWCVAKDQILPQKTEILEQGINVIKNHKVFFKLLKPKLKKAKGVKFHNTLKMEEKREGEHIWIGGSTGAGKTQMLSHIIDSILERVKQERAKLILFDVKGDYCAQLAHNTKKEGLNKRILLINPTDERSTKWDLAGDLAGDEIACDTFASAFIPPNAKAQQYFIEAPKEIIVGALMYLHDTYGVKWGWDTFNELLNDTRTLKIALDKIKHPASKHIQYKDGQLSTQAANLISSMGAPLKSINVIAKYWKGAGGAKLLKWFMQDECKSGVVIIASKANQIKYMQPLQTALTNMMISEGLSLGEKPRDIWFVLDELAALNKIPELQSLLTLGRSFNLKCVAATQDVPQIREVYGDNLAATIIGQFTTQFWGVLNNQESATFAANQFGNQRIERLNISENQSQGVASGLSFTPAVSTSWQRLDSSSALVDSDFLGLQKATKDGYYFWAKVTDSKGILHAGLLNFKISPINKIYPHFIDANNATNNNISNKLNVTKSNNNNKKEETEKSVKVMEDKENKINYIIQENIDVDNTLEEDNNNDNDNKNEEDDGISSEITAEVVDSLLPGLGSLIELNENLDGGKNNSNSTIIQTAQATSKKKKRKKIKQDFDLGV